MLISVLALSLGGICGSLVLPTVEWGSGGDMVEAIGLGVEMKKAGLTLCASDPPGP